MMPLRMIAEYDCWWLPRSLICFLPFCLQSMLLRSVAAASHAFMHSWNVTEVVGQSTMEAVLQRPPGQGLITVSNHVAAMDDPLVISTIVPPEYFAQPERLR